jgi:hypothetical protein
MAEQQLAHALERADAAMDACANSLGTPTFRINFQVYRTAMRRVRRMRFLAAITVSNDRLE